MKQITFLLIAIAALIGGVAFTAAAPGDDHGVDAGADGTGEVRQPRMYQLIRQKASIDDVSFEIEFLDPGVEVFSFTFG